MSLFSNHRQLNLDNGLMCQDLATCVTTKTHSSLHLMLVSVFLSSQCD